MELIEIFTDYMPVFMFASLALLLFSGYPVAFLLGGLSIAYGLIGYSFGMFSLIEFFNFVPRVWGGAAENLQMNPSTLRFRMQKLGVQLSDPRRDLA